MIMSKNRPKTQPTPRLEAKGTGNAAQASVLTKPMASAVAKYSGDFDLQINSSPPGDKFVTKILGMAFLPDGSLTIIDSKNKCIKVFKPDWYEYAFRKDFEDEPRGITSTSTSEVVITFAYKQEVHRYKIGQENNILLQKMFKVREKPFSISYSKNSLAIEIGEGKEGAILITDLDGKELQKISGNRRNFGLFTGNTIRLAHDHGTKFLYVVDIVHDCVNCVDYGGHIKWTGNVKGPRDINVHEDIIFVASKADNIVFEISKEDGKCTPLLTSDDNIIQPRFLTYQPTKQKLAVEVGGNVVNLYMLSKN